MSTSSDITEYRLDALEGAVGEIRTAVQTIANSMQTLAALEARHGETREALTRAFHELEDHDARLRVMELEQPTQKLVRKWVLAGVFSVLTLAGYMVYEVVHPVRQNPPANQSVQPVN